MFIFRKIWRTLFSCNTRFEIRPFALLPANYQHIWLLESFTSVRDISQRLSSTTTDDSTFFLYDIDEVKLFVDAFTLFSIFWKPNISSREISGIGSLKKVKQALCGLKIVDLSNDNIKILDVYFSCNKEIQTQNNYLSTVKIFHKVLPLPSTRNLTLERRLRIFHTLRMSKIVCLS